MKKGRLILETGSIFEGTMIGRMDRGYGEVVFHTGMTGYQEILTDPSYAGQIVVMTYPLIGNYGINPADFESNKAWLSGFITSEICEEPSHWQSHTSLQAYMEEQGIVGLTNVDTRALVRLIREQGALRGWIVPVESVAQITAAELGFPDVMTGQVDRVTTPAIYQASQTGSYHVVVVDLGAKQNIVQSLIQLGCQVTVVPAKTSLETIQGLKPDGILLSNGPGDPLDLVELVPTVQALAETYPIMGICLGHQLLALSFGAMTGKMAFGHHGANHPVKDLLSGRIFITSQNHGYTVLANELPKTLEITHLNVNDGSVEGLQVKGLPVFSVQFHPEACPGPQDSQILFDTFLQHMAEKEERQLVYSS